MKGFKNSTRMQQGFNFPQQPTQLVSHYTRNRPMAKAKGGPVTQTVGDQGNSATQRGNPPITTLDEQHGGKTPLRPGFAKGGALRPRTGVVKNGKMVETEHRTSKQAVKQFLKDAESAKTLPLKKAQGGEVKKKSSPPPEKAKPVTGAAVTPEELAKLRAADKNPRYVPPKVPLASGGVVAYAKGGDIKQDKKMIKEALNKHVAAPRPRGHGVK